MYTSYSRRNCQSPTRDDGTLATRHWPESLAASSGQISVAAAGRVEPVAERDEIRIYICHKAFTLQAFSPPEGRQSTTVHWWFPHTRRLQAKAASGPLRKAPHNPRAMGTPSRRCRSSHWRTSTRRLVDSRSTNPRGHHASPALFSVQWRLDHPCQSSTASYPIQRLRRHMLDSLEHPCYEREERFSPSCCHPAVCRANLPHMAKERGIRRP